MIQVTRLNKEVFTLNEDHIEMIEETPDTVITLLSGRKHVVLESAQEIIERVIEFHRLTLQESFQSKLRHSDS